MSKYIPKIGDVITMSASKSCGDRSYTGDEWKVVNNNGVSLNLSCEKDKGLLAKGIIIEIADRDFGLAWPKDEETDKPKRVRVYIKEDAYVNHHIDLEMEVAKGLVYTATRVNASSQVEVDSNLFGRWSFNVGDYVVVEGSLEDLK